MEHLAKQDLQRVSRRTLLKIAALSLGASLIDLKIKPLEPQLEADEIELDAKIAISIDNREFVYFGSNIKAKDNQIIFGRNKTDKKDAYKMLGDGKILGPYHFVHFAYDPEFCSYQVIDKKVRIKTNPLDLYKSPTIWCRSEDYCSNLDYDFYHGILTVFNLEQDKPAVKKYTFDPSLPAEPLFYPKKREFADAWELQEVRPGMLRRKNRVSPLPMVVDLEKKLGSTKTIAYIYELFPFGGV